MAQMWANADTSVIRSRAAAGGRSRVNRAEESKAPGWAFRAMLVAWQCSARWAPPAGPGRRSAGSRSIMYVERLRLTDFRNYRELDLALPRGLVVFTGRNAQGKSNLLEAVSLIATSKSFRTTGERETVRWGASGLFARVDATVARRAGPLHVEVVVA